MRLLFSITCCICCIFFSTPIFAGESITYEVDGSSFEGYYAVAKKDAPLVIIIHDWDGLTEYEKNRSSMLVERGYNVFAADLFGAGIRPVEVKDKKQLTGQLYKDRATMRKRIGAAVTTAKGLGLNTDNAVLVGYCFGGAAALEFARSGFDLQGFVAFHGGLATPADQNYEEATGSYLILHGSADSVVPMTDFAKLTEQLEEEGLDHEMVTYSGAPHAFSVFGSQNYHQEADQKSWRQFTQWLEVTL